uniref:TSC22 domain family, member 2 n=1 Tax=Periophthalmus magnuspinnatus TaxID=409849 RepID=A0A3B4A3D8_9GOBI
MILVLRFLARSFVQKICVKCVIIIIVCSALLGLLVYLVNEKIKLILLVILPLNFASGTNVVAIDNKIEQAMDLVKSHLMYAVREEVEVLKEQIKELFERNSVLERENAVLKSLANTEQLSQLSAQTSSTPPQPALLAPNPPLQTPLDPSQQLQPNVTSA